MNYSFANEKLMKSAFGLRHLPDRFSSLANAERCVSHSVKPARILCVDENPLGIAPAFYVVCPADASRVIRETEGAINYAE